MRRICCDTGFGLSDRPSRRSLGPRKSEPMISLSGETISPLKSVFNHSAPADSSRDSAASARSTQKLATAAESTAAESFVSSGPESDRERKYKNSIHTFVISWFGKHENADSIVKAVAQTSTYVSVIYSDPNIDVLPQFSCQAIRRPNDLFFGDKFRACLEFLRC